MQYAFPLLALIGAVTASPFDRRQGITSAIAPTVKAPSGCSASYSGTFGIAVMNVTAAGSGGGAVATQTSDGQPAAGSSLASVYIPSQKSDGQPQVPTSAVIVTQISDGQPQAGTTMVAISQISDGQIQAPHPTPTPPPQTTVAPISQISDGQPQAPKTTVAPVSQISDGQPQVPKSTPAITVAPVSQKTDGQPNAATTFAKMQRIQANKNVTPAKRQNPVTVACQTNSTLSLTLNSGVLKDSRGRTGYIASNFQFQFDDPPQAGSIYTSGFSVCSNGSLALGGSAVWYRCLSGNFYNLYDRWWAAQCEPVVISAVQLKNCPS